MCSKKSYDQQVQVYGTVTCGCSSKDKWSYSCRTYILTYEGYYDGYPPVFKHGNWTFPFLDAFPIKLPLYMGFSTAMFDYRKLQVHPLIKWPLACSLKCHPLTKQVPLTGWIQILIFCGMVDFGLYRLGFWRLSNFGCVYRPIQCVYI